MPIYEYKCSKCGVVEVFQRITDDPLTKCPTCQRKVTKLISQSSFHLKGSGWYVTDYAKKGGRDGAKAETASKDGAGAQDGETKKEKASTAKEASTSGTETKPAGKSKPKSAGPAAA